MNATLTREFGLEVSDYVSEESLLLALEARLAAFLRTEPVRLLQILYRIDVDERAAEAAMDNANASAALACLILRHVQLKAAVRAASSPPPATDEDPDLLL